MARLSLRKSSKSNKLKRKKVFKLSTFFLETSVRVLCFKFMSRIFVFIFFLLIGKSFFAQECDSCALFVPNTLTPDCEQFECELLQITSNCAILEFELTVYNRWGEQLFYSDNLSNKFDCSDVKEGTYFWVISGAFCENQQVDLSGYVNVLR